MPREPKTLPPLRPGLTWCAALLLALAARAQVPILAPSQDPDLDTRAAALHAMAMLKIAPYLTIEAQEPAPAPKPKPQPKPEPKPEPPPKPDPKPVPPPSPAARTFRIGLVGADQVTAVAPGQLAGKQVGEAVVTLVVVTPEQAVEGSLAGAYDMLYIAPTVGSEQLRQIVASHADKPVPLVCRLPGFARLGGSVQLFVKDNGLRFEINADSLRKQGVRVDPQLRKLSREGPR